MAGEDDGIERGDRISRSRRGRKPEPVEADVVANADLGAVPYYKLFSSADLTDYLLMFVGTMGAIGNGTCLPLMTVLLGEVVNALGDDIHMKNMYRSQVVHQVSKVSLKFVYLAMGTMVGAFLQVSCWIITGERQATRVRCLYLKAILRQEIGFFEKETTSTGETTVGRMSGDSVLIQDAMGEKVGKFLQLIATFIAGFAIALVKGWKLAMVMALFIPLVFLSSAITSLVITKIASRVQAAQTVAATVVEQTIASMRTVASFTGEKQATAQYNESLATAYKCSVQEGLAAGFASGVVKFFILCSYALGLWFGARMITNDGYKGGDVLVVIFALLNGSLSLGHASSCLSAFGAGKVAAFKMFEVIDRKPEIDADNPDGRILDHFRGNVKLTDVYFCYPSRPEEPILSGFSLSMPSGSSTALVGVSGSGKSTVISLMERFFDPQAGEVLVDGINLKELQLKWVRQRIALVSQEPVLFPCSIKDNVGYGKDGATTEEIRAAVELANAAEFIDKMPQGLDTMVGEHGSQLSGGQKQRLAIARAIIRDPRVLLLDEATSALDPESERTVQWTLDRIMINRTTLVVAHRLSTVKNAHMIAVIHGGTIVEKGSHTELTKDPDGAYSQLIRLQEISRLPENSVLHDPNKNSQDINSTQHFPFLSSISADVSLGVYNAQLHLPSATSSQQPPEVSLYRLAHLNKPEIPVLLLGTLAAIANGVIFPVFGVLISSMIRTFFEASDELQKDSRFWAVMFVALGFVCLLVHPLRSYFFVVAGCKLIRRIRSKCFERVVHMEISWFDEPGHSSGAIGARLSADAALVSRVVGDALGLLVQNTASAVAGLAIAFEANWELAFIVLVLLPLILVNGYVQLKFIEGFTGDATRTYEGASEVANDAVRGIRTVASLCAEEKVIQVYQKRCGDTLVSGIREGLISGMGYGFSLFLLFCFYAATFYAGARLIEAGNTTFAQVLRVHFALSMAAIGVTQSGSLIPDASKAESAAASIFGILDLKTQIDSSDHSKGMIIDSFKGEIEFEHVSFKYPARPQVQILRDVCLVIPHGKIVALIGESGCGKSTVVSLLQRFYEPDAGRIKVDGIEIKKLRVEWLRQQMGVVNQEPVLFNDTIRANIAYGYGGGSSRFYTEAEIVAASEKANAHSFITGLGQGYDTIVGEGGIQLSGGQKQRVAIARAIVKVPRILLLDEPTSALDRLSESLVQKALLDGNGTTTTLVVAHRLSTIQNADFIAVLRNGVVAEQGTHHTLISIHNGIYSSLLDLHSLSSNSNFL